MKLIKRIFKLGILSIALLILSFGYRFLGKKTDESAPNFLGPQDARADVPGCSCGGCGGCGCGGSGGGDS